MCVHAVNAFNGNKHVFLFSLERRSKSSGGPADVDESVASFTADAESVSPTIPVIPDDGVSPLEDLLSTNVPQHASGNDCDNSAANVEEEEEEDEEYLLEQFLAMADRKSAVGRPPPSSW